MSEGAKASEERFSRFSDRDEALVRWRFGRGYVGELVERRYRRIFGGGRRVLDVGCGVGEAAPWADGAEYFGIDLSESLILEGTREGGRHLAVASVLRLPFADGTFDRVGCMGVLHHLGPGEVAAALREMARVVRLEGSVVIVEPNPWNFYQWLFAWVRSAERGILAVSPRALRKIMTEEAGLAIVEFEYDHTMFWPSYVTFLLRRWAWPTGPRMTAFLRRLHRLVVALTPGPLRSHTFWRLRNRSVDKPPSV